MNQNTKKAAVKKNAEFKELELDDLILKLIDGGYNEDDSKEIAEAIKALEPEITTVPLNELFSESYDEELGESIYDESDNWKAYKEAESKLVGLENRTYLECNAIGCFFTRVNKNGEKVEVLRGIKMIKGVIKETIIPTDSARRMNEQIFSKQSEESSKYYIAKDLVSC